MKPLVTIMIPTYNQEAYLEYAIKSALAQDYENLEVIIADDCSTDETRGIAQKYFENTRFKYYRNNTNFGKTKNYRHCLYELAGGEWVLNLDGDDYLIDNHYISFAMKQIDLHDKVVLFTAGVIEAFEKKYNMHYTHRIVEEQICLDGINLFLNWHSYKIPHLTSLYHRQTACGIGFYASDISSTDWESLLRLVLHGKAILSERIGGVWRKHENNLSQSITCAQLIDNFALITGPYNYAANFGLDRSLLIKWKQNMIKHIMRGQFDDAWRNALQKKDWPEIKHFACQIKRERPAFARLFFRVKNIALFCYCCAVIILSGLTRKIKIIISGNFTGKN